MEIYALLSEALRYPDPGSLERLRSGLEQADESPARTELETFLASVERLGLDGWEELYTRTLDLNPAVAPYIGFQVWGESYQRGGFLSALNRAMYESKVDLEGELPDHLTSVLRYLARTGEPLPALSEQLAPAVRRMVSVLSAAEPQNPYVRLLRAVLIAWEAGPVMGASERGAESRRKYELE